MTEKSMTLYIIVWMYFCVNFYVNGESCQGAIVENGTNETIVDSNNDTWTLVIGDSIVKNGQAAGYSAAVVRLVYWNGTIYQENRYGGWWKWVNNNWIGVTDRVLMSYLASSLGCTPPIPPVTSTSPTSIISGTDITTLPWFLHYTCNDSNYIGQFCNRSIKPCAIFHPCQNLGYCTDNRSTTYGYSCSCQSGFYGIHCEYGKRPCSPTTCWHNGTCTELNRTSFHCSCEEGRTGIHCELPIDLCQNVTCLNKGICRQSLLDFQCQCISGISGRFCQNTSKSLFVRQLIATGFALIAILAMTVFIGYIVILDILKYVFHIDITRKEREQLAYDRSARLKNLRKKRKPHIVTRPRYVNKPTFVV